jgi:hypothetical protein
MEMMTTIKDRPNSGLRAKAKIRLVEFLRPACYWPHPYTIEQAFQVFRWMVKTGEGYRSPGRWGSSGVTELLSKKPSCCGFSAVSTIRSLDDLRQRFHYALLSNHGSSAVSQWWTERRITVDAEHIISFPHYTPLAGPPRPRPRFRSEADIVRAIEDLLDKHRGERFETQLNSIHRDARVIHSIVVGVDPAGFTFDLAYGFNADGPGEMDSEWRETLARSEGNEPFVDVLAHALTRFDAIKAGTEPDHRTHWEDDCPPAPDDSPAPSMSP